MADEIIDQILYQKGFNHAYWLSRDEKGQEYLKNLRETNKSQSYKEGLDKGRKEYLREEFLNQARDTSKKKDKGLDI